MQPAISDVRTSRGDNGRVDRGSVVAPDAPSTLWLAALPLLLTGLVFAPIVRNYFYGDDLLAIYDVANRPLVDLLMRPYGGHVQATRNLLYLLLLHLFGPAPGPYYLIVLLTHLANVGLLFGVIRQLTGSARLACFGAALWGAAPVNEGALGWYSVYGQVLVVTALLWLLHRLGRVARLGRVSWPELAAWGVLLCAASTSFGLGLAVTAVMPAVAWLLLPATPARRRAVAALSVIAVAVLAGWQWITHLAALRYPELPQIGPWIGGPGSWGPSIDLVWRMGVYGMKGLLLGPLAHLVDHTGWIAWGLTLAAIAAAAFAGATAPAARRRQMLACLLLSAACYASIAAGRVIFYAALGDVLVRSERYHYAAPLPLAILCTLVLAQLDAWWTAPARLKTGALAGWALGFAALQTVVGRQIDHHDPQRNQAERALAAMQQLILAQPPGQDVYIQNQTFFGVGPLVIKNPQNFPGWAGLFAVFHAEPTVAGRRVFFVEPDGEVRAAAAGGSRSGALLVAPEDVPAARVLQLPAHRPPAAAAP